MAQLAIKGHATRGREVIELLEMLGGINHNKYSGDLYNEYYFINDNYVDWSTEKYLESDSICFTLEEFLEQYPFKVGDKVVYKEKDNTEMQTYIKGIEWNGSEILYEVNYGFVCLFTGIKVNQLRPYKKEEAMEEKRIPPYMDYDVRTKETMEGELMPKINFSKYCKDKYLLDMGDYEIKVEDGKTYVVRKKPQYPKAKRECYKIFNRSPEDDVVWGHKAFLLGRFQELLVCRDAYWKIAGEQMGLGKPWEPDYKLFCAGTSHRNAILSFPTEEMRDAFYENFKDLIESCKELL